MRAPQCKTALLKSLTHAEIQCHDRSNVNKLIEIQLFIPLWRLIEGRDALYRLDQLHGLFTSVDDPVCEKSSNFTDQPRLQVWANGARGNSEHSEEEDWLGSANLLPFGISRENDDREMVTHLCHVSVEALLGCVGVK